MKVLKLTGTAAERARAHGALVGRDLSPDVIRYFSHEVLRALELVPSWGRKPVQAALEKFLASMRARIPAELRAEIDAFTGAAPWLKDDFERALLAPDLGSLAIAWQKLAPIRVARQLFGCTSVVKRNPDGDLVMGRNLDFVGAGVIDANPLVVVHLPTEPGELKRAGLTSDGVHFPSITGVNEAGLFVALHQNFASEGSPFGIPVLLVGDMVLRRARSIDEAVAFLRETRPGPMWSFELIDLNTGDAAVVEASRARFGVRRMRGDQFALTNHLGASETRSAEFTSLATWVNSHRRRVKAHAMLARMDRHDLSAARVAGILSHQETVNGEFSLYNDIMKPDTVQTMIIEKRAGRGPVVYVSQDEAPSASGRFCGIALADLFSAADQALPFTIRGLAQAPPEHRARQRAAVVAEGVFWDGKDPRLAVEALRDATAPGVLLAKAVAHLRLGENRAAVELSVVADRHPELPLYIQQSFHLVRALGLRGLGDEPASRAVAERVLAQGLENPSWRRLFERLRAGARLPATVAHLSFDFFCGDIRAAPLGPEELPRLEDPDLVG